MGHLTEVRTVRDDVADMCEERIRTTLEIAQSERMRGVAIFYQMADGSFGTAYCVQDNAVMLGGLEIVKARMLKAQSS